MSRASLGAPTQVWEEIFEKNNQQKNFPCAPESADVGNRPIPGLALPRMNYVPLGKAVKCLMFSSVRWVVAWLGGRERVNYRTCREASRSSICDFLGGGVSPWACDFPAVKEGAHCWPPQSSWPSTGESPRSPARHTSVRALTRK